MQSLYSNAFLKNVGIGTNSPQYKLDVAGELRTLSNAFLGGYVGIGTNTPSYKLQVNDGEIAIVNTVDTKSWILNYYQPGKYLQLREGIATRLVVANGGNVGIGTTTPAALLDVNGNAAINGALTVNSGKGVLHTLQNSQGLSYYTRTVSFSVTNLAPHSLSPEESLLFADGFLNAPVVFVANEFANSGSLGPLHSLELVVYDVMPTRCHVRIRNTSNSTITQSCTWNVVCIGN